MILIFHSTKKTYWMKNHVVNLVFCSMLCLLLIDVAADGDVVVGGGVVVVADDEDAVDVVRNSLFQVSIQWNEYLSNYWDQ